MPKCVIQDAFVQLLLFVNFWLIVHMFAAIHFYVSVMHNGMTENYISYVPLPSPNGGELKTFSLCCLI